MKKVRLNGLFMGTKEKAHRQLKRRLGFPDYYGANLDALSDCLSELGPAEITLTHAAYLKKKLGGAYAAKLLSVLIAATGENPKLHVEVRNGF